MLNILETNIDGRSKIRPALFSGKFYLSNPEALKTYTKQLLIDAPLRVFPYDKLRALIVPEGQHTICGKILATAYKILGLKKYVRRIFLFSKRRVGIEGLIFDGNHFWETPLGSVEVVHPKIISNYIIDSRPHFDSPAIETQLPFIQTVLPRFSITPILTDKTVGVEVINSFISSVSTKESVFIFITSSSQNSNRAITEDNNFFDLLSELSSSRNWNKLTLGEENRIPTSKFPHIKESQQAAALLG